MKPYILSLLLLSFGSSHAASLTLYTSQPSQDAEQTVSAFKQANPDIEVTWIRDGTTKLLAKLQAELAGGVVKPDVLLIADAVSMEALKKADRLLPYQSAYAPNYPAALYDKAGFYHATKLITTGIVYHQKAAQQPQAWADLAKPAYKGLVAMPSPLYSGAALIHVASLTADKTLGWDYIQALAANKAQAQGGNGGVLKAVSSGQKPYGVIVDYMALRQAAKGAPIQFVFPREGVSVVTEPVAIMKGSKNPKSAQKFVDFVLSPQGQALVADMGYLPAAKNAKAPKGFPEPAKIKFLPFDAQSALENTDANKQRFAHIFAK